MSSEPSSREAWIDERLRAEFPGLGLHWLTLPAPRLGRSPRGVRDHLDVLAARFRGADALLLRQRPVPHAYRVFHRHIGLDPDVTRTPVEAAVVERLVQGGFPSRGLLDDALTIALVETGVPVWALDAEAVAGGLRLRLTEREERLGGEPDAPPLPSGRIVVADDRVPLAPLFGELAPGRGVTRRTRTLLLYALRVDGVSLLEVEEALWACAEVLRAG
jgi:DNA/RNA-binding domain of Phe-tRNA-synthetase-like protein